MANVSIDQAAGLRRLHAAPQRGLCTVLSADADADKAALMHKLATSMRRRGSAVTLLDARGSATSGQPSLADVLAGRATLESATVTGAGDIKYLVLGDVSMPAATEALLRQFADRGARVLVDAALDSKGCLPLPSLSEGEIVVQLSGSPDSIKQAYAMLKALQALRISGSLSILVTADDPTRAQKIHANLFQAASRYLALSVKSIIAPQGVRHV